MASMTPLKVLPGISIDLRADGLAHLQLRQRLLRQIEVDEDGIERLQRDNGGARRQILTQIHLPQPQAPGKRRRDDSLLDQGVLRLPPGRARSCNVATSPSITAWLMACAANCSWSRL